jgi:hypothetical protein
LLAKITQTPATGSVVVATAKRFTFTFIFVLGLVAIVDANAASTLRMTCSGKLINTRADGVTLGDCDLNFISVKQMDEIEHVCGIPELLTHRLKINVE